MYLLLIASDDEFHVQQFSTKEDLMTYLAEEYDEVDTSEIEIHDTVPTETDPQNWPKGILVVKGEVVVPRVRQVFFSVE